MRKLIRLLLVLTIGVVFGYVFHNSIDTKLKARFGNERVEAGKKKVENGTEKHIMQEKQVLLPLKKNLIQQQPSK